MKRIGGALVVLLLIIQSVAAQAAPSLEQYGATPVADNRAQIVWKLRGMGKLSADMQFAPNGCILLPLAGQLASVDTQGKVQWTAKAAGGNMGRPVCSEIGLIFAPCSSSVQEIKPNGAMGWSFTVYPAASGNKNQQLAYGQSNLYLPLASGLYVLDLTGRMVSLSHWDTSELHATKVEQKYDCLACAMTGNACYVVNTLDASQFHLSVFDAKGGKLWSYGLGELKQACIAPGSGGTVFLAAEPKKADRITKAKVSSFVSQSNKPQWQTTINDDKFLGLSGVAAGHLYLTVDGRMYALDANTGAIQWDTTFANLSTPPAVDTRTGYIYAGCSDGRLIAVDPAGRLAWDLSLDSAVSQRPLTAADGFLYAVTGSGSLYKIRVPEM